MESSERKLNMKKDVTYKFCSCGLSKNLPFCDESHKEFNETNGTNYKSVKITPEEDTSVNVSCKNWEKKY